MEAKPRPETPKPSEPQCLPMKPKRKSRLRSIFQVLKTLFWVDYGDLKQPVHRSKVKPEPETDEEQEEDELTEEESDFRIYG